MADYSEKQIIPFVNKAIKLYLQFYLVLATYPFVVWVGIKSFFLFFRTAARFNKSELFKN